MNLNLGTLMATLMIAKASGELYAIYQGQKTLMHSEETTVIAAENVGEALLGITQGKKPNFGLLHLDQITPDEISRIHPNLLDKLTVEQTLELANKLHRAVEIKTEKIAPRIRRLRDWLAAALAHQGPTTLGEANMDMVQKYVKDPAKMHPLTALLRDDVKFTPSFLRKVFSVERSQLSKSGEKPRSFDKLMNSVVDAFLSARDYEELYHFLNTPSLPEPLWYNERVAEYVREYGEYMADDDDFEQKEEGEESGEGKGKGKGKGRKVERWTGADLEEEDGEQNQTGEIVSEGEDEEQQALDDGESEEEDDSSNASTSSQQSTKIPQELTLQDPPEKVVKSFVDLIGRLFHRKPRKPAVTPSLPKVPLDSDVEIEYEQETAVPSTPRKPVMSRWPHGNKAVGDKDKPSSKDAFPLSEGSSFDQWSAVDISSKHGSSGKKPKVKLEDEYDLASALPEVWEEAPLKKTSHSKKSDKTQSKIDSGKKNPIKSLQIDDGEDEEGEVSSQQTRDSASDDGDSDEPQVMTPEMSEALTEKQSTVETAHENSTEAGSEQDESDSEQEEDDSEQEEGKKASKLPRPHLSTTEAQESFIDLRSQSSRSQSNSGDEVEAEAETKPSSKTQISTKSEDEDQDQRKDDGSEESDREAQDEPSVDELSTSSGEYERETKRVSKMMDRLQKEQKVREATIRKLTRRRERLHKQLTTTEEELQARQESLEKFMSEAQESFYGEVEEEEGEEDDEGETFEKEKFSASQRIATGEDQGVATKVVEGVTPKRGERGWSEGWTHASRLFRETEEEDNSSKHRKRQHRRSKHGSSKKDKHSRH